MERFCHIGKIVDCNEVFRSKGAKIAGAGLGELALFYFTTLYLFTLSSRNNFHVIALICSIVAFGFTLYSVFYQFLVLRKGCLLCMLVNFAVWGNVSTLFLLKSNFNLDVFWSPLLLFILSGCICLAIILYIKSLHKQRVEQLFLKTQSSRLYNTNTFQALLSLEPEIGEMISQDIALCNRQTSRFDLMIVTNPNCANCARDYRYLKDAASSLSISLVLLTFPNDKLGEKIAQAVIAAYFNKGWDSAIELLGRWYENSNMDVTKMYEFTDGVYKIWADQQIYCWTQQIDKTPSIIVDKRYLPEVYSLSELKYVLT